MEPLVGLEVGEHAASEPHHLRIEHGGEEGVAGHSAEVVVAVDQLDAVEIAGVEARSDHHGELVPVADRDVEAGVEALRDVAVVVEDGEVDLGAGAEVADFEDQAGIAGAADAVAQVEQRVDLVDRRRAVDAEEHRDGALGQAGEQVGVAVAVRDLDGLPEAVELERAAEQAGDPGASGGQRAVEAVRAGVADHGAGAVIEGPAGDVVVQALGGQGRREEGAEREKEEREGEVGHGGGGRTIGGTEEGKVQPGDHPAKWPVPEIPRNSGRIRPAEPRRGCASTRRRSGGSRG